MFSKFVEVELKWQEKATWMKKYIPEIPKWKLLHHFNFIVIHYLYILFFVILGSVILYGIGEMRYIDALFFASGASTQSGLNTIDVNRIYLSQQVTLILIACVTNPIWINTMVVFIRLYWFEKRFQNVVKDAREWRRTRTKSRTRSEMRQDLQTAHDGEERGVGGRAIHVVRSPNGNANINRDALLTSAVRNSEKDKGVSMTPVSPRLESPSTFHRNIMFADEVRPSKMHNEERMPVKRSKEESIRFVENQRKPLDRPVIHIPGPRDFERGERPRQVEAGDLERSTTADDDLEDSNHNAPQSESDRSNDLNVDEKMDKSDEEVRPARNKWLAGFTRMLVPHRSYSTSVATKDDDDNSMHLRGRGRTRSFASFLSARSQERADRDPMPYLSYTATIGRNSMFVDLTEEQREELGGVEYRALKTLAWILSIYYLGFHAFGMVCLVPWIWTTRFKAVPQAVSQDPTWWGFFTSMSLFTDLGFTLTPDSMISFQYALFLLLLGSFLIVIGNTGFPCMLRFVIWASTKIVSCNSALYEELRFLLDHPRRCFTLLFPRQATWWLFAILVIFNLIDIIFFIILDLKDPTITVLPPGIRLVDGIFQAFSTRTAGFAVVNLAELHPAIQVSYLIMMYISIFPIAISVRRTNVYEEKSLGVYTNPISSSDDDGDTEKKSYIGSHLRRQLSFDLWYVFLGLFVICIVEGGRLENTNDYAFTVFSVLFEIVSAYGTVGLSLGYPNTNASFSAQFRVLSKLVIIAMQIRGRHRGLPYALDRAILLPSESLHRKEAEASSRSAYNARAHEQAQVEGHTPLTATTSRRYSTGTLDGPERRSTLLSLTSQKHGLRRVLSGAMSAGPARQKPRHHKQA